MTGITTHVLDTALGRPARNVGVLLERRSARGWRVLGRGRTNEDGRVTGLLPRELSLERGTYRLTFATGAYFKARRSPAFYPEVSVVFEIRDASQHHHVPLLLSPFGYSTYRGS